MKRNFELWWQSWMKSRQNRTVTMKDAAKDTWDFLTKPTNECVCMETNSRNCPEHQNSWEQDEVQGGDSISATKRIEQAKAIVGKIGNIGNRPDLREVQNYQTQMILQLCIEVERDVLARIPHEDDLMAWIRGKIDKEGIRPNEFQTRAWILNKLKGF